MYRSMSLHSILDGRNAIVDAQLDSETELKAAVEQPEVKAARKALESRGAPNGTIYAIESLYLADDK